MDEKKCILTMFPPSSVTCIFQEGIVYVPHVGDVGLQDRALAKFKG